MFLRSFFCKDCSSIFLKICKKTIPCHVLAIVRYAHNERGDSYHKVKRWKRIFSTVLFGSTLAAALVVQQRRKQKLKDLVADCQLLPADYNYAKPRMFYLYKDCILPDFVVNQRNELQKFQVREDDLFVVSFPKTGTTWIQEIVYLIATDLDFDGAKAQGLETRFPYLEYVYPGLTTVEKMPSPRFIKSHLPLSLLPKEVEVKKPKIISILRNPKDVAVSFYHFLRMLSPTSYKGTFEEFLETFFNDKVMYGPLWKHYLEFWERRDDANVLLLKYEDMHQDIHGCIEKICDFLGKELTEVEFNRVIEHCTFEKMAQNPNVNYQYWDDLGLRNKNEAAFMRKGEVGDWRNYFTAEMNQRMDKWIEEHFTPVGLQFTYTLTPEK